MVPTYDYPQWASASFVGARQCPALTVAVAPNVEHLWLSPASFSSGNAIRVAILVADAGDSLVEEGRTR